MDNTKRFSSRVDTYARYRPSYPKELIDYLYDDIGFRADSKIADIGAGTGIFTKLLLERGSDVTAAEPNRAMREAAEKTLGGYPNFQAVSGSAEATTLADRSVGFIVCAQAFHWFDRTAAQAEFRRILEPGGQVVLIWNSRLTQGTPFREAYEQLLRTYATDYDKVNHKNISSAELHSFFKEGTMQEKTFAMSQKFDFESLKGRLLSSSYSPEPGHPDHMPMMAELLHLFDQNQQEGIVPFDYETEIFWGEV